jgi:hypothetical protein
MELELPLLGSGVQTCDGVQEAVECVLGDRQLTWMIRRSGQRLRRAYRRQVALGWA